MNIQIYYIKRDFDAQKAERYFKERKIPFHFVDMKRHAMGPRELKTVAAAVGGAKKLIDTTSKRYPSHPIRMMMGEQAILDALLLEPALIKTPIVRNGSKATVGFCPEVWESWS